MQLEQQKGKYVATIAILDALNILSRIHPAPIHRLHDTLPFVASSIFSVHDGWRYHRLEQRWQIALKCFQLFRRVAIDSRWFLETTGTRDVDSGCIALLNAFFRDSSLYNTLFNLIGLGQSFLNRVEHVQRTGEIAVLGAMIHEALCLLEVLLDFRLSTAAAAR